jgi:hypothetical protein
MAIEDIGVLVPTKIPGLADAADIQEALRVYHYGGSGYEATSAQTSLPAVGIARRLLEISDDITALENRPSSGGDVDDDAPVAGDFTPSGIPNGYIWVDSNGSLGGAPTGATAVFTNSAPTSSITTGTVWVDKDATAITANPFIPQAVINAKGDLIAGSANDTATVLSVGTNGQVLKANSATTSGLEWATDNSYSAPTLGSTSIASGATVTTIAGLTLTAPTATSPTFTGTTKIAQLLETTTLSTSAVTATQNYDVLTNGAVTYVTASNTSNYTLNVRGDGSTTLNSVMSTGQSLTIAHLVTNGGTAYYLTALQIDGTTSGVTLEWQNGAAPSAGNVNSVDIYSITIIKTGNAAFTAFAAQTRFA